MLERQLEGTQLRRSALRRGREMLRGTGVLMVLLAAWIARAPDAGAQRIERHATVTGPTLAGERVAFPGLAAVPATTAARPNRPAALALRLRNRTKLMLFGTAVFITGAIIGDDAGTVIMIGGAAVALTGLYLTLWPPDERPTRRRAEAGRQ